MKLITSTTTSGPMNCIQYFHVKVVYHQLVIFREGAGAAGFNNIYPKDRTIRSKVFSLCVFFIQMLEKEYYFVPKGFKRMHCLVVFTKKYISDFLLCTRFCTWPIERKWEYTQTT